MADKFKQNILKPSSNFDIYERNYHKPQRFVIRNGISVEEDCDDKVPKTCRAKHLVGNDMFNYAAAPVLTFGAYYLDNLGDGDKATTRFRKCNVLYYLDDDDLKVYEPVQKNSGLTQGCIIGKGKFKKPEGGFYTIDDLNIGESLILNGKEYKLINCDKFTRRFMTEMGYRMRSPQPDVYDPITEDRNEANTLRSYRKPIAKEYKLASFYKHHPKRLRFYVRYGEDKNLFEVQKEVTLYYDLSDGTIKLVEERCNNEIDGSCRVILRPTLVPKRLEPSLPPGEMCDPTLLNLAHDFQNVLIGGKYFKIQNPTSILADSNPLEGRKKKVDYIKDTDIDLGIPLDVFGFKVLPYDCDEFTKNYYRSTYNKELIPVPQPAEDVFRTHKLVYKHEDFGAPEETLRTNDPFTPKADKVDLLKFFRCGRYGYDVRELKFLARIITEDPVEKLRHYTVCWMLEDDTMTIRGLEFDKEKACSMEHAHFNRMRVVKPHSSHENAGRCFYQPTDMYVGNVICVRGRAFELLEADEYTYDYMEKNSNIFLHSNIRKILLGFKDWITSKCGTLKSRFESTDCERTGHTCYEDFRTALYSEMSKELRNCYPEHAIRTVARYYADMDYIGLRFDDLVSEVQTELYRKKFYDFEDLRLAFKIQDSEKKGFLDPDRIYYVLRTTSIPLSRDLLKSFLYKFPKIENKIQYSCLIEALDWINHPAEFDKREPHAIQINWERIEEARNMDKIKYNCFMMDVLSS